jgi:transcriptional regulator with XRE-family HTH domain
MKKNSLFDQCVANVAPEVMEEVSLNVDIANRIYDLLKEKKMTQREFAALMGKRESEISRWLTGSHGFTTTTLAKISAVLGEPVVMVKKDPQVQYVFVPIQNYITLSERFGGTYVNKENSECLMAYLN